MRYIITRPDLQEGSLRLLKYMDPLFSQSGAACFVDDRAEEHAVQVDRERGRIWGLAPLFRGGNLGVNDVLMLTPLAPGRFQAEGIVKPYAAPQPPRPPKAAAPETRRVVVSTTPHVREVRMQTVAAAPTVNTRPTDAAPEVAPAAAPTTQATPIQAPPTQALRAAESAPTPAAGPALDVRFPAPVSAPAPAPARRAPAFDAPIPQDAAGQLQEFARLTGYRVTDLGGGVTRLSADLGAHGYSVLVALNDAAMSSAAWTSDAEYRLLLTTEAERPQGTPRLTREALVALIEHARLAPLSPVDLRGYWKAGSLDLESAASVAELVGAFLAQRGAFSFVLLTLAQQPAHSVVSVPRLAERLGSGVNYAELGSILDTLTRAPFLALTPLPAGQYLLRVGVPELLTELAEYAEGVGRRVRTPAAAGASREAVRA